MGAALPLVMAALTGELSSAINRRVVSIELLVIAGALFGLGGIFLLVALYVFLASEFGSLAAALTIAGVFIVIGVIVLVWRGMKISALRRQAQKRDYKPLVAATGMALAPMVARAPMGYVLLPALFAAGAYYAVRQKRGGRPLF